MSNIRKKRNIITTSTVKSARNHLEKNKSVKEISELLDLSYSSTLKLCNRIDCGEQDVQIVGIKKGRPFKNKSSIKSIISSIVLIDNSLTQRGIAEKLQESNFNVTQSYISKILKEMEFSRKRLSLVPEERNSPRVLESRQLYAREIANIELEKLVFLDETGFNLHTAQHYGYSPKNVKAFIMVPANKGQNISLMAAISVNGIIGYELNEGAYNGGLFIKFIRTKIVPYFANNTSSVLIMDNCRFHHRRDVLQLLNINHIAYVFLPAYSPQLNPIEEYFSELKSNYRSIRPISKTNSEIKSRVINLIESRNNGFLSGFEKAKGLLRNALARQPFI